MGIGNPMLLEENIEGRKVQSLPFLLSRNMISYTLKIPGFCPNEVIHFKAFAYCLDKTVAHRSGQKV
jgi:hypothetical protein